MAQSIAPSNRAGNSNQGAAVPSQTLRPVQAALRGDVMPVSRQRAAGLNGSGSIRSYKMNDEVTLDRPSQPMGAMGNAAAPTRHHPWTFVPWWHWRRLIGHNMRREEHHFKLNGNVGPFVYRYSRAKKVARDELAKRYDVGETTQARQTR